MAKRRLSLQQKRRVLAGRARPLTSGSDGGEMSAGRSGLVVARYGKQVELLDPNDPRGMVKRCHLRTHMEPVVGDRVQWQDAGLQGVVTAVDPRHSVLRRRERTGIRVLAANIDQIVLVLAPEPEPHAFLVDRFLAAAELEGIDALLVLNKSDLPDTRKLDAIGRARARLGYPMVKMSARSGVGMEALRRHLEGRISVFCGQSGVGKSSLINRIFPAAPAAVGTLSAGAVKGRHTTTIARYYTLNGGAVIDSPGIREFDVPRDDNKPLIHGFVELRSLAGECRFRNCRHLDDPGCAIAAATATGAVDRERLASFHQLLGTD